FPVSTGFPISRTAASSASACSIPHSKRQPSDPRYGRETLPSQLPSPSCTGSALSVSSNILPLSYNPSCLKHAQNGMRVILPFVLFLSQSFPPLFRNTVVLTCLAAYHLLIRGQEFLLLHAVKQRIQRARLQLKHVLRPLSQRLDHLIAIHVLL